MENTNLQTEKAKNTSFAFFCVIFLMVLLSLICQVIFDLLSLTEYVKNIISSLLSIISITIVLLVFKNTQATREKFFKGFNRFNPIYLIPCVLIAFGMMGGLGFINVLISDVLIKTGVKIMPEISIITGFDFALYIALLAILPAIFEELFFRGFFLDNLGEEKTFSAMIITALFFSLYHHSIVQTFYQFIYGFFLSFLTVKAKSVIPAVIAHFLNNFYVLLDSFLNINTNIKSIILIISGLIALAIATLFLVFFDRKKFARKINLKSFFIPYGIFGIAICVMLAIGGIL